MGTCASANCTIKKKGTGNRPGRTRKPVQLIKRPNENDLSSSMDNYDLHNQREEDLELLAPQVEQAEAAEVGVYFLRKELLERISKQ